MRWQQQKNSQWNANGMMFSTADSDNDRTTKSCAAIQRTGWWFNICGTAVLNRNSKGSWTTGSPVNDVQISRMLVTVN